MKKQKEVAIEMEIESIEWALVSEDQLLDWYQITDKEMAMCLQSLNRFYYGFRLHSSVSFVVFLD